MGGDRYRVVSAGGPAAADGLEADLMLMTGVSRHHVVLWRSLTARLRRHFLVADHPFSDIRPSYTRSEVSLPRHCCHHAPRSVASCSLRSC